MVSRRAFFGVLGLVTLGSWTAAAGAAGQKGQTRKLATVTLTISGMI